MNSITVNKLSKEYRYFEKAAGLRGSIQSLFRRQTKVRQALSDFSCTIGEGEFVGLMGPNGAGKTTLIKLLTGIIQPTGGQVTVNGFCPAKGEATFKKSFALVMGQKSQLWWDLPASDSLLLTKAIYAIPDRQYREALAYFTGLFAVENILSIPVRKLSLGERMKLELIAALLHSPRLLLLDEPTIGLDAVAQRQIRDMLKTAGRERGVTLLLTSHYTEDLLELTKRCIVLRSGRKIYDGDLQQLLARHSLASTITVAFSAAKKLPALAGAEILQQSEYAAVIRTPKQQVENCLQQVLALSDIADIKIVDEDATLLVERVYQGV
ncbi:ATP-binding cassette domain-containing protein [Sporomusa sp. KB1]|uniref:ABC transporter ATP-binding protein n=1 Tax=Sporomusa sp. KB1 TaxID=943346 RepID=UPI00119F2347|nr:ATP-binding cassette domain-containing protein [Sporomusa sp. KB1]TWH51713.1 ABC-2 type transport system ATP-binding protein [Sporomusa sp. KB1]